MKKAKEIAKNNWDFTLYKTAEGYIINVVFYSSFSDYSRSFLLNELNSFEIDYLKSLSETIRNNYSDFEEHEITPAFSPDVL